MMTKLKLSALLLTLTLLTSCQFMKDTFKFKDKTEEFVESMMSKDYDKCIAQMALETNEGKNAVTDTLKLGLERFRGLIEQNFGNGKFKYSLMKTEKKRSTIPSENTPPNTTTAFVEFANEMEFGVFQVSFDDTSKKILSISTLEVKKPIPNMLVFWLFGIFPLAVLFFNIYVIRKIRKSTLRKKWLKYLAVILLNIPTISYAAVGGMSIKLFHFQFLLGVGFSAMGYLGSIWAFSIPLGGLYCLWKIRKEKKAEIIRRQTAPSYISDIFLNDEPAA